MHPRQSPLPSAIEEIWLAALADVEINAEDALLYTLKGESGGGYNARYLHRGLEIHPEGEPEQLHPLLEAMNDAACIDACRVAVFTDRSIEGTAALVRHELEHARQREVQGSRLMDLYRIAEDVIKERVGGLTGGALLYQAIPVEMDANAAAAVFVRDHFGATRIDALLQARDPDSAAFRSLVGHPRSRRSPSAWSTSSQWFPISASAWRRGTIFRSRLSSMCMAGVAPASSGNGSSMIRR
jgi:hypothetical protein